MHGSVEERIFDAIFVSEEHFVVAPGEGLKLIQKWRFLCYLVKNLPKLAITSTRTYFSSTKNSF